MKHLNQDNPNRSDPNLPCFKVGREQLPIVNSLAFIGTIAVASWAALIVRFSDLY